MKREVINFEDSDQALAIGYASFESAARAIAKQIGDTDKEFIKDIAYELKRVEVVKFGDWYWWDGREECEHCHSKPEKKFEAYLHSY